MNIDLIKYGDVFRWYCPISFMLNDGSMIGKFSRYYMTTIIIVTLFVLGSTVEAATNTSCYETDTQYVLNFTLGKMLNPATLAPGDVLGSGTTSGSLTCKSVNTNDNFRLIYEPKSVAVYGNYVCKTNIPGVGIRYYTLGDAAIPCSSYGGIVGINNPKINVAYPFSEKVFDLVRTDEALPPSGVYNLDLPIKTIQSLWEIPNSRSVWGVLNLTGDTGIVVNNCSVANATQTVDFGKLSKGEQVERSFNIELNQCGGTQAIDDFKNHANLRFESTYMMPDGRLGNSICSTCARETNIEIQNSEGVVLDLNRDINFLDAQIVGDTGLRKSFKAVIKPASSTPGIIDSYLNFIIEFI